MIKVNLGCGGLIWDGYINVDRENWPGVDLVHDIEEKPLPMVCDLIVADDLLEHLTEWGLKNIIASLKPGGVLTAKVPHYMYRGAYADYQHQRWISSETMHSTWWLRDLIEVKEVKVYYSIFGYMWTMPLWFVHFHEKMFPGVFPPVWVCHKLIKKG